MKSLLFCFCCGWADNILFVL